MSKIMYLLKKYMSFVTYGIFGILTTLVNIIVYSLCYNHAGMSNTLSNIIAWIIAVAFAYLTNKVWVFESGSWKLELLKKEIMAFVSCRLVTGIMDLIIMYICVDILNWNAMLMKFTSNVIVIVLNYIFSKLIVFRKR